MEDLGTKNSQQRTYRTRRSDSDRPPQALSLDLLTVPEVAETLRISKWSVYQLIWAGQLGSIKIGRRRLIARAALHHFVDRRQAEDHQ